MINKIRLFSTVIFLCFGLNAAEPHHVQIGSKTSARGNGNWVWTVYVGGESESLSAVRCIHYGLDSAVPELERKVCQAGRAGLAFAASGNATGGRFPVKAIVEWVDGSTTELPPYSVLPPALQ